jgi:hypothetical protein
MLVVSGMAWASVARATDANEGRWTAGVSVSGTVGTASILRNGDVTAGMRGLTGGQLGVEVGPSEHWGGRLAVTVAGENFRFASPGLGIDGQLREVSVLAEAGAFAVAGHAAGWKGEFGVGLLYGEGRSTRRTGAVESGEPRSFYFGAGASARAICSLASRVDGFLEIEALGYRGHARDGTLGAKYDWLGQAFFAGAGVSFRLLGGAHDAP